MNFEDVNAFLIEQATGRTKEQITSDIENIELRRAEMEQLEASLAKLQASNETETAINRDLKEENTQLSKIKQSLGNEHRELEKAHKHVSATLPLLRAEHSAYEAAVASYKADHEAYEARMAQLAAQEAELLEEEARLVTLKAELDIERRTNAIQAKKNADALAISTEQLSIIELNHQPAHFYLAKIQKLLDAKGIKFDILKELARNNVV
jgi:predicted RNase H-like nuclease (RuvC/YqgF family)